MSSFPERSDYGRDALTESDLDPDPIVQFRRWYDVAVASGAIEPHAMTLATATPDGQPSARVVLLRGVDDRGFSFFTNYESRKGRDLEENPRAALVFFWAELERQVRVEGRVVRVSEAESDDYFASRPRGSRLGAWASPQSAVIPDREAFEGLLRDLEEKYPDEDVPRPPTWGGYRVVPDSFEFWQGRPSRLHDRFRYSRREDDSWLIERLAP
jgi:pyridoxamine 5'-phosphate oxidase